jgi:hypothetical protein
VTLEDVCQRRVLGHSGRLWDRAAVERPGRPVANAAE